MDYNKEPKVELHLHLDCSLSYDVVKQLNPSITFEEYKQSFIAPPKCTDLADYIKRAIKGFRINANKGAITACYTGSIQATKSRQRAICRNTVCPFATYYAWIEI